MIKNVRLKAAIFQSGLVQREVAERAGVPVNYLSMCLNGRLIFTAAEQERIAKVLNVEVKDIFKPWDNAR